MQFPRLLARTGLALALVALLAGCETVDKSVASVKQGVGGLHMPAMPSMSSLRFWDSKPDAPVAIACPEVTLVQDLRALHQFEEGNPKPGTKISSAFFSGVAAQCAHNGKNLIMQITLYLRGELGVRALAKKSDRPSFSYPYFVAVTDRGGNVLAKEIFSASMSYDAKQRIAAQEENIREIVPIADTEDVKNYTVMIGFQLTDAELAYNRSLLDASLLTGTKLLTAPVPGAGAAAAKKHSRRTVKPGVKPAVPPEAAAPQTAPASALVPAATFAPVPAPSVLPSAAAQAAPQGQPQGQQSGLNDPFVPVAPAQGSAPAAMMDDEISAPPEVDRNEVIYSSEGGSAQGSAPEEEAAPTDITAPAP
jgi:hypothetical protein